MSDIDTTLHLITRTLETSAEGEAQLMVELLLFPELATLANKERPSKAALMDLAEDLLKNEPLDEITRRSVSGTPEIMRAELKVEPAKRTEAWREPVTMTLEAVVWEQGAHVLATVPALGIAVIAPDRERLPKMLNEHALSALKRGEWNTSLLRLAMLARGEVSVQPVTWSPRLETAVDRWKKFLNEDQGPDILAQLCTRMEGAFLPRAYELETELKQLSRLLTLPDQPSVLLLGAAGVGKTALTQEMARRRSDFGLGQQPFYRSSGTRLIAGASGFGMWQQRCRELVETARKQKLVLYLGNLFELMNVGQSSTGSESIASFLRPYLVRRELQVIVECTHEQMVVIEKQDPRLADAFRILKLEEPQAEKLAALMLTASTKLAGDRARFSRPALERVRSLHRRYLGYSAFPGAPLRFMTRLHENIPAERLVEEPDVYAAFSRETGMPEHLLNPETPLDLDITRTWFQNRVEGQGEAVDVVVSVIAQIKAGLARPGRPLASLLFIGPTGTGKTEMAKALAEFLFQSAERMIRLDMSEYGQPWSAQRLVSGSHDGREGLLTAAVREQPFSVLLLDEFEKADPAVFDLLLQLLGEARLTDGAGRTADFSNCVVIMTSNLGAQDFSKGRMGFSSGGAAHQDATDHFTTAVQKALRPEMFNRIDRIVPYQPLSSEVVVSLTRREIATAALRPGFVKAGLRLEVSEAVVQNLAREGYDPRYGARPLKRRVAEHLLAPISALIAEGVAEKSLLKADLDSLGHVLLQVVKPGTNTEEKQALQNLRDRLRSTAHLRQAYESLRSSTMVNGLQGRLRMAQQRQRNSQGKAKNAVAWTAHDPETETLKQCLARIDKDAQKQLTHEEGLILALHHSDLAVLNRRDPLSKNDLEEAVLEAYALWQPPPKRLLFLIHGQPGKSMMAFAAMYRDLALDLGGKVEAGVFHKQTPAKLLSQDGQYAFAYVPEKEADQLQLWQEEPGKVAAMALWISGEKATLLLKNEGGLHLMKASRDKEDEPEKPARPSERKAIQAEKDWTCRIEVSVPEDNAQDLTELMLATTEIIGQPNLEKGVIRRQYDPVRMLVRDGPGGIRTSGSFQKSWLLRGLREAVLKEALA
ncbi:ATP-dependent Clp protease ATP-binding subunit ClpA [Prosthecobacter fusiformis]|uniref:ATP-dependent Clp protease ATP-binding subunit ClpA n=1 Tax=Prosthecobacter fusiformis TaxID=48464 RepID=A0A4R7S0Y5_9BACT|nr:AAA family ATPase [Prosthecobacter fusiformis]TDU70835.1 ATP-dependent Clp protease ATP-binding subunit ClpA [Prosthecobacter fusiformis]